MRRQLKRHARPRARLPAVHLLPAVTPRAPEARHVGELYRQRRRAVGSRQADDDAVTQLARPVGVDLAADTRGTAGGDEGGGGDAELVLVDVDDALGVLVGGSEGGWGWKGRKEGRGQTTNLVLYDGEGRGGDLAEVRAEDEGRFGDGPEPEVEALFVGVELAVSDNLPPRRG